MHIWPLRRASDNVRTDTALVIFSVKRPSRCENILLKGWKVLYAKELGDFDVLFVVRVRWTWQYTTAIISRDLEVGVSGACGSSIC